MNSRYKTLLFVGVALLVVAAIALVLGFVGTIGGMIHAFDTIAESDSAPRPEELATDISKAMMFTLVGFGAAIAFTVIGLLFVIPAAIGLVRERRQLYLDVTGDSPCKTTSNTATHAPGAFGR